MSRIHYMPGLPRAEFLEQFEAIQSLLHSWIHVRVMGQDPLEPDYRETPFDRLPASSWRRGDHHHPRICPEEKIWFHVKAVGNCENGFPYLVVNVDHLDTDFLPRYEYRLWLARISLGE
jgi:hypothetical protein